MAIDRISVASSHAKFKAAADMLRWAMSAEICGAIDQQEVLDTVARIEEWSRVSWRLLADQPAKGRK